VSHAADKNQISVGGINKEREKKELQTLIRAAGYFLFFLLL
jgi:phage replication-related protein YjqB (UPF0714/DUF867 family)